MTWTSLKGNQSVNAYPRTLSWIAISVGGLALFLTLGCLILVSNPFGSTVRGYFYTFGSTEQLGVSLSTDSPAVEFPQVDNVDEEMSDESNSQVSMIKSSLKEPRTVTKITESNDSSNPLDVEKVEDTATPGDRVKDVTLQSNATENNQSSDTMETEDVDSASFDSNSQVPTNQSRPSLPSDSDTGGLKEPGFVTETTESKVPSSFSDTEKVKDPKTPDPELSSGSPLGDGSKNVTSPPNTTDNDQRSNNEGTEDINAGSFGSKIGDVPPRNSSRDDSGCDLYQGKWIYDLRGPLYTNNTCPVLTQSQNCQGNGRPDKDYENWRWQPEQCELPRFDARKFLELMRGKTIAFVGDSVARNQMESLLCILWQVEVPKNRGNKKMHRYYFKSTSTMIVRIWSSWLVKSTTEPADFAPGVVKLHLDAPDDEIMGAFLQFDVIVLSSGHWFAKQSVYLLNNEVVGGQLWWPDKSKPRKISNAEAFEISVETIVSSLAMHPNFTGLTIVRSFSPDHYMGGEWNTGGSCIGKTKPLAGGELEENGFTNLMHEKQVTGFNRAVKKKTNKSKMILMDITRVFEYRQDGHPGPYRNTDPNKLTTRGPNGKPPPQDCLHWCMPGPVDTWNEFVFELVRREYEDSTSLSL